MVPGATALHLFDFSVTCALICVNSPRVGPGDRKLEARQRRAPDRGLGTPGLSCSCSPAPRWGVVVLRRQLLC